MMKMERAVILTKNLSDEQKKELKNFAESEFTLVAEYSSEEFLLKDARQRIIEKHNGSLYVIERGKFDCVVIYSSKHVSENTLNQLKEYGIRVVDFQRQKQIREETKNYKEEDGVDVNIKEEQDFVELEPL